MPRIKADNIAEHVAQQHAAVVNAAVRLFIAHGFTEVSLGDIAVEVGLARNSLYRYVPDKLHVLVAWYRSVVPRTITEWEAAVAGDDPPSMRLKRWARSYLAWAASPEHALVAPLTDSLNQLDTATRREVADLHRSMMDVVARVVADTAMPATEVPDTVDLLAGVTLGAARARSRSGPDSGDATLSRLDAAIDALLAPMAY